MFRPHRGLAAPDIFLDTMLNQRTWEACSFRHGCARAGAQSRLLERTRRGECGEGEIAAE
jgi:hypothetical protein